MFISTDRTFHFIWLPESIGKVRKCLFDCISNPLERKLIVYPPPLRKFTSFRPPYPSEFPWPSVGWVWIFSGTTHWNFQRGGENPLCRGGGGIIVILWNYKYYYSIIIIIIIFIITNIRVLYYLCNGGSNCKSLGGYAWYLNKANELLLIC